MVGQTRQEERARERTRLQRAFDSDIPSTLRVEGTAARGCYVRADGPGSFELVCGLSTSKPLERANALACEQCSQSRPHCLGAEHGMSINTSSKAEDRRT